MDKKIFLWLTSVLNVFLLLSKRVLASDGCQIGWFGDECQFKCHCTTHTCNSRGECYKCGAGYFGISCQYVNMASRDIAMTNPVYLTDENENTCNPSRYAKHVKLTFIRDFRISWFRVYVNNETALELFQVKLNNIGNLCVKERRYKVSKFSLDVTCDTQILVKLLVLQGEVAPYVCSIYVSGGRNVALLQLAKQTNTLDGLVDTNGPQNAVDGETDGDVKNGFCASTGYRSLGSEWNVTLKYPSIIYRINIYNSNERKELLSGFTFNSFDSSLNVIDTISDTDNTIQSLYVLVLKSSTPIKYVSITGASSGSVLTLCEVEIYGENVCSDKTYGIMCNSPCKCKGHEICNVATGMCAEGCPKGYFGFQCASTCDKKCAKERCLQTTGQCYGCPAGYMGDKCNEECKAGTYGKTCENVCPVNCMDKCDLFDGICNCKIGHKGVKCTECSPGTYGINCAHNCSIHCPGHKCNTVTGICPSCEYPRLGPNCADCPPGFYGTDCTFSCSQFCTDRLCDSNTGDCLSCAGGHIGKTCSECPANYFGISCAVPCPEQCENRICNSITGLCDKCSDGFNGQLCSSGSWEENSIMYVVPLLAIVIVVGVVIIFRTGPSKRMKKQDSAVPSISSEDMR